MLKRDFGFKMKALDNGTGAFDGLLAVYNNVDLGGDVVLPGAFARSIQNQGSTVPLLWQHRTDEPIGTLTLIDGPNALQVQGQLLMDLPMAQKAYTLLKNKIIKGMSIGYDTIQDKVENGVRYLKELRLWEGSLVTFPMNEAAVVTAVKNFHDAEDLIRTADACDPEVQKYLHSLKALLQKSLHKDTDCQCPCAACSDHYCENCDNALCFDTNCGGHTDVERKQAQQLHSHLRLAQDIAQRISEISVEAPFERV